MMHARARRALAALCLFAAPALAQDPAEVQIKELREAADAQAAVPEAARDADWDVRHQRTLYHLGVSLSTYRPVNVGRNYYLQRGLQVLEELAFEAGEGTTMGLHAYVAIADIHAAKGDWEQAAAFYGAVAHDLLGEPGEESVRMEPVPEPRLDAPVELVEDGFVEDEEVIEDAPIAEEQPAPEEPIEPDPVELEERLCATLGDWRQAQGQRSRAAVARAIEALADTSRGTPASLRADLVLGDLRTAQGSHVEAAAHYAAVVRALTRGNAPPTPGR